jgi:hypothetical protein
MAPSSKQVLHLQVLLQLLEVLVVFSGALNAPAAELCRVWLMVVWWSS